MNKHDKFLVIQARLGISFITVFCLLIFSFPVSTSGFDFSTVDLNDSGTAQAGATTNLTASEITARTTEANISGIGATPDPTAAGQCMAQPFKYGTPCFTASFFGMYLASGFCVAPGTCQATAVTPLGGVGMGAIGGIVNGVIQLGLKAVSGSGSTGSPYPSYTPTNPYGQPACTGTRYISPTPTQDPCGVYIPTTTITNPKIDLTGGGGGTTTVINNNSGVVTATLSVAPTSGPAPLSVTFTVTDTSTSCTHGAVSISAGDGTPSATAIPATNSCTGRIPQILTYTYKTAGTYTATITDQSTMKIIQSVTVTVTGGTTTKPPIGGGITSASLSVAPTSGAAPLKVTFTVTDTSTACPRAGIVLSAGDGSAPVTALAVTNQCTGVAPAQFTYTYGKPGTYTAAIADQDTQKILQSVTVNVGVTTSLGGGTTSGVTSATLSVVPTSGPAPLKVMFTITDTSTACPRSEIALSAGDGSALVTALAATNQCTGVAPAQFSYTYSKAGTYKVEIADMSAQKILQSVTVTVSAGATTTTPPPSGTDTTNATLTVVPTSGEAPLNVKFTVTDISTSCPRSEVTLSAGDGSAPVTALPATVTCIGITPAVLNYTYRNAGTFTAAIGNQSTKKVYQGVVVTVVPGNKATTTPLTAPLTAPTASTVNVSSSLLNLSNGSGSNSLAPNNAIVPQAPTVQSGTWGDIQANASGVTITAGAHDKDGRTGIAGFYGYNSVPGVQPQDLARQMCAARPWASSSATAIIPPSFYDSICTARGYKAGVAAPASSAGTATSKSPAPSSTAKTPSKTATKAGPTPVTVPPKVFITAVPASIRIGSRTSIFWNAVGVKSCLITSPDGSFVGKTLYGAASTVPLTGETVFSIACIKPDDSQITNFVKVKMTI